jgi:hypothetical protein
MGVAGHLRVQAWACLPARSVEMRTRRGVTGPARNLGLCSSYTTWIGHDPLDWGGGCQDKIF